MTTDRPTEEQLRLRARFNLDEYHRFLGRRETPWLVLAAIAAIVWAASALI